MSSTKIKSSERWSHCIPPRHANRFKTIGPILSQFFGLFWYILLLHVTCWPTCDLIICPKACLIKWTFWGELCRAPGVPNGSQEDPSCSATVAPTVATGKMRELKVSQSCGSMSFCGVVLSVFFSMKLFQRASRWFGPNKSSWSSHAAKVSIWLGFLPYCLQAVTPIRSQFQQLGKKVAPVQPVFQIDDPEGLQLEPAKFKLTEAQGGQCSAPMMPAMSMYLVIGIKAAIYVRFLIWEWPCVEIAWIKFH